MIDLERALIEIQELVTRPGIPSMVIGGLANAVWGIPRSTLDIDMTIRVEMIDVPNTIHQLTRTFHRSSRNLFPSSRKHGEYISLVQSLHGLFLLCFLLFVVPLIF